MPDIFRFAHITDQHLCDRPVGNRAASYPDEMKAKMREVVDLCVAQKRHLFMTGDLFDSKRPNHVSHGLVKWLIDLFGEMHAAKLPVWAIAGNHDLSEEGMASLWKQPLGVLASSGAIQLVDDVFFPQMYEGFKIQVTPFNYHEDGESEASFFTSKRLRNTDYHILMTHGAVAPDKEQLPYPHVTYTEFPKRGVDMVLCGHLHHDYGSQLVGGTEFVQYGSLARRSRTQMRDVVVPLIDLHRNSGDGDVYAEVVPYKLKCAVPWQDVFVSSDTMPEYLIDPELTDLARDARSMMSLDDLDFGQVLSALEVPEPVMARVRHYMEEAGYGTGS